MANQDFSQSKEWEVSSKQLLRSHGTAKTPRDQQNSAKLVHETELLAGDILRLAHNTLRIDLRYLEPAFAKISPTHDLDTLEMATDGQFLYYNSIYICRLYQKARELPTRNYLHTTLHCLFRHLFVNRKVRADLWDLACDIAVENAINELNLASLMCERQTAQAWLIRELKKELPRISAEWVYKYFDEQDISPEEVQRLAVHFHADDHSSWHQQAEQEKSGDEPEENAPGESDGDEQENAAPEHAAEADQTAESEGEDAEQGEEELTALQGGDEEGTGTGGKENNAEQGDKKALTPQELSEAWQEIARRIQVDMESHSESWGEGTGDLQQNIREVTKEKADYTQFLKRFSVLGENVEINDDEFDYLFYTYGLKLYGNMPLVEPLEYKDVKKIRDFVIALDTSNSVSGEVVQQFVTKTWNILKQSENFFARVNVHIIQCGARVEEDVRITTQDEFDEYMKTMTLRGFGGTDFRPVFAHVNELIRQKEFTNLKGIIYFTDGFGTFPAEPPSYDAAFVFLDQGYDLPDVPPWAIRVLLNEDEIREF